MVTIALAALAAAAAAVFGLLKFGWGSAVLMGLIAGPAVLVIVWRRAGKPVQAALDAVEKDLKAQRYERAIEQLRRARRLAVWQPLLASHVDEQIGVIHYAALKDPDGARPYLERARRKSAQGWTMLAASLYRRGRYEETERVLRRAARRRSKEGLVWGTYAWCKLNRGGRAAALVVLARARKRLPGDDRLRRMQLAVQNGKPPRMRTFGAEWYALELERASPGPPTSGVSRDHPALRRRGGGRPR